ncbi:isopenicillin N synthase family dioxygenase [Shimia sp. MMG029]|uniref:isopenicillin N synthase family dioxygenase n=1 Tax=Shimia sp. MMG029 TaxID=3021978 RepID=UPI0022FE93AF|nr:2-oxoglutarate and iron-dependent oxygenase domain-containing protein [Shimia sp. MMG029]MDA5556223.1 2-oxoglutarate and iron-dependent oxygenase domain-containing protein [Shimia sp. MMG029]
MAEQLDIKSRNASRLLAGQGSTAPFTEIPVISIAALFGDNLAAKQEVAESIRAACMQVGFFQVTDHQVDMTAQAEAFAAAKRFFAQPEAEKRKVSVQNSPLLRGYGGLLEENTDPDNDGDLHEHFDLALDLGPEDPDTLAGTYGCGPNQWPDLENFRDPVMAYHREMVALSAVLFRGFALSLELPETFFDPHITKPIAELRLAHYPPQTPQHDPEKIMGIGAHSDYDAFTVVATGNVPALEVQNAADDWIAVPPMPEAFVVNVGDLLQRWTNDLYRSTFHRVVNRTGLERYSLPFFASTNPLWELGVLENCQSPERPARYEPISAADYIGTLMRESYGM